MSESFSPQPEQSKFPSQDRIRLELGLDGPKAPNQTPYITPPTDGQIAKAAEDGFDLTQWEKYYSKDEWAARNNQQ